MMIAKQGFESSKNTLIQQETRQTVLEYEADKMRSRLSNLYSAMNSLGDGKLMKDQHEAQREKELLNKNRIQEQLKEIQEKLTKENDLNREKDVIIKDIEKRVSKVQEEKIRFGKIF